MLIDISLLTGYGSLIRQLIIWDTNMCVTLWIQWLRILCSSEHFTSNVQLFESLWHCLHDKNFTLGSFALAQKVSKKKQQKPKNAIKSE